jgi:type VI secretion system protein ImpJ
VATRWLLHALRSAEAPLRHLLTTRRAHPERLWLELARLAGALCTFSLTAQPRDLPAYVHDDLAGCFGALARHLRAHLDLVIAPRVLVVALQARTVTMPAPPAPPTAPAAPERPLTLVLHVGLVSEPRCFEPGARWFLGVRTRTELATTVREVPRSVKVCNVRFAPELVRRGMAGHAARARAGPARRRRPRVRTRRTSRSRSPIRAPS